MLYNKVNLTSSDICEENYNNSNIDEEKYNNGENENNKLLLIWEILKVIIVAIFNIAMFAVKILFKIFKSIVVFSFAISVFVLFGSDR